MAAFRQGLPEGGYIEGQNIAIEYRWASANYDRLPELAAELVARKVDVIVTGGGRPPPCGKQASSIIPIVCFVGIDPVRHGLVASIARPGGNLTGMSLHGLDAKRIELLCELVPEAKAIAILVNPNVPFIEDQISDAEQAARTKGVQLHVVTTQELRARSRQPSPLPALLHADAIVIVGNPLFSRMMSETAALPTRYSLPDNSGRFYVEAGGLLSYESGFVRCIAAKGSTRERS